MRSLAISRRRSSTVASGPTLTREASLLSARVTSTEIVSLDSPSIEAEPGEGAGCREYTA